MLTGIVALRKLHDKVVRIGLPGCLVDQACLFSLTKVLERSSSKTVQDIVLDRPFKQGGFYTQNKVSCVAACLCISDDYLDSLAQSAADTTSN